jgi:hypothetical protein
MSLLGSGPSSDISKNKLVVNDAVVRKTLVANVVKSQLVSTENLTSQLVSTEDLIVKGLAVEDFLTVGGTPVTGNVSMEVGLSADFPMVTDGATNNALMFDVVLSGDASLLDPSGFLIIPEDGTYFVYGAILVRTTADAPPFPDARLRLNPALVINPDFMAPPFYTQAKITRDERTVSIGLAEDNISMEVTMNATFDLVAGDVVAFGNQCTVSGVGGAPIAAQTTAAIANLTPFPPPTPPNYATYLGFHKVA